MNTNQTSEAGEKLPDPMNGKNNPVHPGIYLVVLQNAEGQHGGCYLWDGECWRGWVTMFDPPEWDPAEMHNCKVVDWMNPDHAMREIYKHRKGQA